MADQTIEIKLILRDELSKALAPIAAQLKELNAVKLEGQPKPGLRFVRC